MMKDFLAKLRRKKRRGFVYAENAMLYRLRGDVKMARLMEKMAKEELDKEIR